jgi:histidyl-tRNA synthetase
MGKYGDEGDQLLFKILNSGDFLKDVSAKNLDEGAKATLTKLSEKGLKYDLTVPFARYVAMNRHELAMPFKRFQIQPVWRADRPQKGRYREFYQCDADVVGTDSLLCEAEIVLMLQEVFEKLGLSEYQIKINNRKILSGIAEVIGSKGEESSLCIAIDKLDKIGKDKVEEELLDCGFSKTSIESLQPFFNIPNDLDNSLLFLKSWLKGSEIGTQGILEIEETLGLLSAFGTDLTKLSLDPTLARGLSYYTGAIFEVKALNVQIGSISGGGRYDNLTGTFGLSGVSGVGISLGVDRIYDVLEELDLFPKDSAESTKVLLIALDKNAYYDSLPMLNGIRKHGISSEIYPEPAKLKKQFDYANKKGIPYVIVIGSEEVKTQKFSLKNMQSGEQEMYDFETIIEKLKS